MADRQYATVEDYRAMVTGAPTRQYTDAQVEYYLTVATAAVEQYTERIFSQETYTEKWRGDASNTHLVYQYPIISATSLEQDTIDTTPVNTAMDVSHLVLDDENVKIGRVELDSFDASGISSFSPSSLYTFVYEGGFAEIPLAVKHATALWCAELLRPDYAGVRDSAPEIIPMTTEQISELLAQYRRRRI